MRTIAPALLLTLLATSVLAQDAAPDWTRTFGSWAHVAGLALTSDDAVLVAYTSAPCEKIATLRSERDFFNTMAVAKIDRNGRTIFEVDVPRPSGEAPGGRGPSMGKIGGVAALDDGDFVVIAEFREGRPWMLRFDDKGGLRFLKQLPREVPTTIHTVLRASDGTIVIGGSADGDFHLSKLAANGRVLWTKTVNGGNIDLVIDLAADAGGGVVAAGMSAANPDAFFAGTTETVVLRVDKDGGITEERRFHGRFPTLAVANGKTAVLYDRGENARAALRLKTLDAKGAEVAEEAVAATLPQARVVARNGAFVVSKGLDARSVATADALYVFATALDDQSGCLSARLSRIPLNR